MQRKELKELWQTMQVTVDFTKLMYLIHLPKLGRTTKNYGICPLKSADAQQIDIDKCETEEEINKYLERIAELKAAVSE